jgi:N-hydroxyarylamine O-acetyltransferase
VTTADDPRPWLCDIGFGAGPLAPLELTPDAGEVRTGDWRFRLERTRGELDTGVWILHQFGHGGWASRIRFTENPSYRIDFAVANHFVSTSPRSPFVGRPFVQRMHPDAHHTLDATTWTVEYPDGTAKFHHVTPRDMPQLLSETFDIDLGPQDATALRAAPWETAGSTA